MANILGINLSDLSQTELLNRLDFFLSGENSHYLVTPNPEIILKASKDEEYFYILNSADLAIADGFGLVLAGIIQGQKISRITGSDLTPILIEKAEKKQLKVLIINWQDGLSKSSDITQALNSRWPNLIFEILDIIKKSNLNLEENNKLKLFKPALVFVTLGAPLQEKLIWHELKNWPSVRLALAVGGSFDFLTNKIKRAPKIISRLGIEWLWRVFLQPQNRVQRLKRIWRATVIFSLRILKDSLIKPFFYRPSVAIMLYKKTDSGVKILIVARQDKPSHWQLPQGGTDGETLEIAGARESREELGTDKFIVKKTFSNLHRYLFPKLLGNGQRHTFYKGQKQGLFIAEFTGNDNDIKINYWDHVAWQWIEPEKLLETVHPYRQEGVKKFLVKFLETIK